MSEYQTDYSNKCFCRSDVTEAMFTRDRSGTDPGRIFGPDRPSVYTGPFWNRSGTDPKLDLLFCRSSIGSDPDRFQKGPV